MSAFRSRFGASNRLQEPIHQDRHVRLVCIGAGASGLMLGYKLKKHFSNFTLTIYEKNEEISGTWFENKYPGCACDVPAHNYTFSFEPKHDWSAIYAGSNEIRDYFVSFANKYGLHDFIKTKHQVTRAQWNEEEGQYCLNIQNLSNGQYMEDMCDILINASGILNNWKWPKIPGLKDFEGKLLHTANWDSSVELTNKRVGIIGNGSSGIQIFPAIQPKVQRCTLFIRTPTWVSPVQGIGQHFFTQEEKDRFKNEPGALLDYRRKVERAGNSAFKLFVKGSKANQEAEAAMRAQMKSKLGNEDLASQLIPNFPVGCRRFTPGIGYLEALSEPNVDIVLGGVSKITKTGCVGSNGSETQLDVLICATGFDTSFKPRFPIINGNGTNLQDLWTSDPESYLGLAVAEFPNYFLFLGPNCPIGNGSVLPAIESEADYICKMIDKYQTHNIHSFAPTREAVRDFVQHKDQYMKNMIWTENCQSWYKAHPRDPDTVTALWPGTSIHHTEALANPLMEDYSVKYRGNRFAWFGNGFSQCEWDSTADTAYYIRDEDDGEPLSLGARLRKIPKRGTITGDDGFDFMGTGVEPQANF